MRRLYILKAIAHFVFIMFAIALVFVIPAFFMLVIMPGSIPFKVNGDAAQNADAELLVLLFLFIVGCVFFVYALYLFRKVLDLFSKRRFFDDAVIRNFDQMGKAIIIGYLISAVPAFVYNMISEAGLKLEFGFSTDSGLCILGLGLFFLVLSEVFLNAKMMKEENDLTI